MNKNKYSSKKVLSKEILITEKMINDFLIITGDKNPIHMKNQFCKDFTDFKEKIVPGALILSIFSAIIGNHYPGMAVLLLNKK